MEMTNRKGETATKNELTAFIKTGLVVTRRQPGVKGYELIAFKWKS